MERKTFILFLILLSVFYTRPLYAQDPDPLPLLSFPDIPTETQIIVKINVDSVIKRNVIEFCGEKIDLRPMEKQRKLQRELNSINSYSGSLIRRSYIFFPIIENILRRYNIPDDFKYLMVIESGMNPYARSEMGAAGLWQFMKETAQQYGLRVDGRIDERMQVDKSTLAACRYLKDAHDKFGDWVAAAQSYNIGQARIGYELTKQKVKDAIDLKLVDETNRYIYRILAAKIIFTNPSNINLSKAQFYYKKIRRR